MFHRRLLFYVSQEVRDLLLCTKYKQTSFEDGIGCMVVIAQKLVS